MIRMYVRSSDERLPQRLGYECHKLSQRATWTTINALGMKAVSSEAGAFMFAYIIYYNKYAFHVKRVT